MSYKPAKKKVLTKKAKKVEDDIGGYTVKKIRRPNSIHASKSRKKEKSNANYSSDESDNRLGKIFRNS